MTLKKINSLVMIIAGVLFFASCSLQKQAEKYYKLHPEQLAKQCMDHYPPIEKLIPGKAQVLRDTVWQKPDSVPCPQGNGKPDKKIPCPPCKSTNTTSTRTDTVKIEDTAKTAYLKSQVDALGQQLSDLGELNHKKDLELKDKDLKIKDLQASKFKLWAGIVSLGLIIAGMVVFIIKRA